MKPQFFLPVLTYPESSSETLLTNAVALAARQQAILHAVAVDVEIPPITSPWSSLLMETDKVALEAEDVSHRQGQYLLNILGNHSASADVALTSDTVRLALSAVNEAITGMARHYGIVLLEAVEKFRALNEAVIFGAGRPVLLLPDESHGGRVEHVAIAWDGSRAAARALGDAAGFIANAREVSIIYALDEKPVEEDLGNRLFESLRARGIRAEAHPWHTHGQPIGEALQAKAADLGADMLVMGAFGHSRLLEFILGGATRTVLTAPILPVFMSH